MKNLFSRLLIVSGSAAAAVGVLAGVERLLRNPRSNDLPKAEYPPAMPAIVPSLDKSKLDGLAHAGSESTPPAPVTSDLQNKNGTVAKTPTDRNFSIKRTKSEVGYVYWILEGFGKYKCFVLCDTWDEAVAQAKAKMAEVDAALSGTQTVPAGA